MKRFILNMEDMIRSYKTQMEAAKKEYMEVEKLREYD